MPIVPGVLITNAIQDLFGGHMLMFTTKSLEALVTAFGIGAGVGSVLIFSIGVSDYVLDIKLYL